MEQQLQQPGLGEGDGLYRHTSGAGLILAPEETKKKEGVFSPKMGSLARPCTVCVLGTYARKWYPPHHNIRLQEMHAYEMYVYDMHPYKMHAL